jgi:hypothetical protein
LAGTPPTTHATLLAFDAATGQRDAAIFAQARRCKSFDDDWLSLRSMTLEALGIRVMPSPHDRLRCDATQGPTRVADDIAEPGTSDDIGLRELLRPERAAERVPL